MKPSGRGLIRVPIICFLFLAAPLLFLQDDALAGDDLSIDGAQIQRETIDILQELEVNAQGAGQKIILGPDTIFRSAGNALRMSRISLTKVTIRDAAYKSLEFGFDRVLDLVGLGGLKKTKVVLKAIKYALNSSTPEEFAGKLGEDAINEIGDKLGLSKVKKKVLDKLYKTIRDAVLPKIEAAGTTTYSNHPDCGRVSIAIWGGGDSTGALAFRVSISGDCEGRYSGKNQTKIGTFSVYGEMPAKLDFEGTGKELKLVVRIAGAGDFYVSAPYPYKPEETAKDEVVEPVQTSYIPPISERICLRRCDDAHGAAAASDSERSQLRDALAAADGKSLEARNNSEKAQEILVQQKRELAQAKKERRNLMRSLAKNRKQLAEKERKYKQMPSGSARKFNLGIEIGKLDKRISAIKRDKLPQADKNIRRIITIVKSDTKNLENSRKIAAAESLAAKKLRRGFTLVSDANKNGQAGFGICMRKCLAQDPKGPWVKLNKTKLRPGAALTVSYRTLWGNRKDAAGNAVGSWLGIAPEDEPELTGAVAGKIMVGKKRHFVPERDVDETALKMQLTAPEEEGDYEVRLYSGTVLVDSFMAAKAKFTVSTATNLKARYKDLPPKTLEVR